jgi:hypothetical protein
MASIGKFFYIPVKDFFLLELIFLTIANKITTSLSLSLGNVTVGDQSASWAEVQRHRNLSEVAIDYALLIDVSASMSYRVTNSNNVTNLNSIITHSARAIGPPSRYFDSRVINSTDAALIVSWIDKKRGSPYDFNALPFNLRLIYRASRDGFGVDRFHNNCDNRGPTFVVVKVRYSGEIIGGYNPLEWRCIKMNEGSALLSYNNDFYVDQQCKTSKSFIFSLTNRVLSRVTSKNEAIIWSRSRGPCFGLQDLCISNNLGISRQHSYENRIINRENFEIEDYEVFQVIDNRPRFTICNCIFMIFMLIFGLIKWTLTILVYAALVAVLVFILAIPILLYLNDEITGAIITSAFIYSIFLVTCCAGCS